MMTDLEKCDTRDDLDEVTAVEGELSPPPVAVTAQRTLSGISPINVRHNFIRKVFMILFAQLVLTACIGLPFILVPRDSIIEFIISNIWLLPVSCILSAFVLWAAYSSKSLLINFPHNYFVLFLFTCGMGIFFGMLSALLSPPIITLSIGTLALVILCLIIFAVQSKWDFSLSTTPYWISFIITVGAFVLMYLFAAGERPFMAVWIIAGMITLLFSFYFVFDTNRIVDGEKTDFHFDIDQYAPAALSLYVDIVRFIMLATRCFLPPRDLSDPHS